MTTLCINGTDYELATNLRVAYEIQNQNNHAPYTQVLSKIDEMTLEQQIAILFAAFKIRNPDVVMTQEAFKNILLDDSSFNVQILMDKIMDVIEGILGRKIRNENSEQTNEGEQGNV